MIDGLKGFPEAISTVYPQCEIPALDCYFGDRPLHCEFCIIMEIDFQAIQTDKLKTRIGELRRYL